MPTPTPSSKSEPKRSGSSTSSAERGAPPSEIALAAEACVAALVSKRVTLERSPSAVSVDPRYLVFELTASVVLRDQQLELVRTFRQALRDKSGLVHQMVMGAGKTTVVAPLLALCLADGDSLVFVGVEDKTFSH